MSRLVKRAKRFPDLPIDALDTRGLEARDAALAQAIDHAVAKRWLTLVALIESQLERPWERVQHEIQAALLAAAAQLFFLDRVPDHAAVDEAVEWVKRKVRPKAGGFVNAVLHSLIRLRGERVTREVEPVDIFSRAEVPLGDGRVLRLTSDTFAPEPLKRLAQGTSHAEPLIARWMKHHGEKKARELCLHDVVEAPIIVGGVEQLNQTEHLAPHGCGGFAVFIAAHSELLDFLHTNPEARVQDPTSAAPVLATRVLQPSVIADLCAGRGTKTAQLAQLHPQARIIASDADHSRMDDLRARFAGSDRIDVIERSRWMEFAGSCDLLVLDVPCTNTGVLARRVEAKYRFSETYLATVIALQKQILADALALRSPHGHVLYSTCSIEREENEDQAAWLAKWHPLRVEREQSTLPAGLPGEPLSRYHDGGYWALLGPD